MLRSIFFVGILLLLIGNSAIAQNDQTLFTVGNTPISVSEFEYIYQKNNGTNATFSEASLREYMNLYAAFKMKVQRAKDVRLDTISALSRELEGYRKQLSRNYLTDREIMASLAKEAYERMKKDVSISHIFIKVPMTASATDTAAAYSKIMKAYNELKTGKSFSATAKGFSEDGTTKDKGGEIGYITGLQLPGFYELETAAYTTKAGNYSEPIRSKIGYHIVYVNDVRPARGQIEVAHILVRVNDKTKEEAEAQKKINRLYRALQDGSVFEDLAKLESEDEQNAAKGGYIGRFGIGEYETTFEEAAFGLSENGAYSRPFRTSVGWHIVKRVNLDGLATYENLKGQLQNRIRRDNRFALAQTALVNDIKTESNFKITENVFADYVKELDASFITYQWKMPVVDNRKPLFSFGNKTYTVGDFNNYLKGASGMRVKYGREQSLEETAKTLLNIYVEQEALKYEEGRLEDKYPDFKALMREYREGIMLFEITKQEVWDKASQDTIGLQKFYDINKANYKWGERAKAVIYTLNTSDEKVIKKFKKYAKRKSPQKVVKKFNKNRDVVTFETGVFEKGKNKMVDATLWKAGMLGSIWEEGEGKKVVKIEAVIPPTIKPLNEARGYIIADYQDYLEKNWIKDLESSYPLKVNETVFKSLVK